MKNLTFSLSTHFISNFNLLSNGILESISNYCKDLELWFSPYGGHINYDEVFFEDLIFELKKYNLNINSLHACIYNDSKQKLHLLCEDYKSFFNHLLIAKEFLNKLISNNLACNDSYIVVHLCDSYNKFTHSELNLLIKRLDSINNLNVKIAIENVVNRYIPFYLIDHILSKYNNLFWCIDLAHINISSSFPNSTVMIDNILNLNNTIAFHLSDNFSCSDDHLFLFKGFINYPYFFNKLKHIKKRLNLVLEVKFYLSNYLPRILNSVLEHYVYINNNYI